MGSGGNAAPNFGGRFDGPAYQLGNTGIGGPVTLASITDGTSNTAIFSEWVKGSGNQVQPGVSAWYKGTTAPGAATISGGSLGSTPRAISAGCQGSTALVTRNNRSLRGFALV
jgi:hypothetical protein